MEVGIPVVILMYMEKRKWKSEGKEEAQERSKNPAHETHSIAQRVRKVAPIPKNSKISHVTYHLLCLAYVIIYVS